MRNEDERGAATRPRPRRTHHQAATFIKHSFLYLLCVKTTKKD